MKLRQDLEKATKQNRVTFPFRCDVIKRFYKDVQDKLVDETLFLQRPTDFLKACSLIWNIASRDMHDELDNRPGNDRIILCRAIVVACAQFSEFCRGVEYPPLTTDDLDALMEEVSNACPTVHVL